MSPECKLPVSEKTHSAALTPRLGSHTSIPLACQGWKLYIHVIPAALKMWVIKLAGLNRKQTGSESEEFNLSSHGL